MKASAKRYQGILAAIDELYARTARAAFPASASLAFVNVVLAFGVDNTGGADAAVKINTALTALAATGQTAYSPDLLRLYRWWCVFGEDIAGQ